MSLPKSKLTLKHDLGDTSKSNVSGFVTLTYNFYPDKPYYRQCSIVTLLYFIIKYLNFDTNIYKIND